MRRASWVLAALALVVTSCGAAEDAAQQTSTTAAPQTAAPTTPAPSTTVLPTTTSSASTTTTTTAAPVDEGPLDFDFALVRGIEEPILDDGDSDDWDANFAFAPNVVFDGSTYHMFYSGWARDSSIGIGYASSVDGLSFTEHPDNPVATLLDDDPDTEAGRSVARIRDDGTWEMFIGEWIDAKTQGNKIWYATASDPTGPWQVSDEPIHEGAVGSWESRVVPQSLSEDGRILYYDGVRLSDIQIGALVRQEDGSWLATDDPATEDATDPILTASSDGDDWDAGSVASPLVFATESGFEMFYAGFWKGSRISKSEYAMMGYATSPDGINWERYEQNPVIELTNENGWLWLGATRDGNSYNIYYAIKAGADGIGLITGTVSER
ncbi:MAG: hypothetical protein HKN91_15480 [Acidimicrobiia bacterium]|nr:hypothetical protein [Acidimicrobiia bacterium]